jgi:Rieske Fe-S protein
MTGLKILKACARPIRLLEFRIRNTIIFIDLGKHRFGGRTGGPNTITSNHSSVKADMKERILNEPGTPPAAEADPTNVHRRRVIGVVATGIVSPMALTSGEAAAATTPDLLVDADAESDFKPLRPDDLKPAKPMLVFPFDTKTGQPKNASRLDKIVVVRLPEEKMTPETRARSVSGVVAYSSICTHQSCDVKTWMSKENVLACYCHASKFDLFDGAKVVGGPASGPLRAVPLALSGEFLSIAANLPPKVGD